MATTDTATTPKSKTRKPAAKRKAATKRTSAPTRSTQPASRVAQVQQLAERAVQIPLDAVAQTRRRIPADVEQLTSRVEKVVRDGAKTGMKLVNGAQDRFARTF